MSVDLAELRKRLEPTRQFRPPPGAVLAAVLVPFLQSDDGWSLVFTRRSDDLSSHAGEISFPGGRIDLGETVVQAALREAQEELGIPPDEVEVIGSLPEIFTVVSGYQISPVVGVISNEEFAPNPKEIAEVVVVPFETLRSPAVQREQRFIRAGVMVANPAYDVGTHTIWGATARILTSLLELVD
jgi:8-oxo-dGTP pyrophosphatase MutT (NUDIX family)